MLIPLIRNRYLWSSSIVHFWPEALTFERVSLLVSRLIGCGPWTRGRVPKAYPPSPEASTFWGQAYPSHLQNFPTVHRFTTHGSSTKLCPGLCALLLLQLLSLLFSFPCFEKRRSIFIFRVVEYPRLVPEFQTDTVPTLLHLQ